jgi:hypothetical protein
MISAARIEAIRNELLGILERLDECGLSMAGAHLAMAIHCLDPDSFDCSESASGGSSD